MISHDAEDRINAFIVRLNERAGFQPLDSPEGIVPAKRPSRSSWSPGDDETFRDLWLKTTNSKMAELFGVELDTIRAHARVLGLPRKDGRRHAA